MSQRKRIVPAMPSVAEDSSLEDDPVSEEASPATQGVSKRKLLYRSSTVKVEEHGSLKHTDMIFSAINSRIQSHAAKERRLRDHHIKVHSSEMSGELAREKRFKMHPMGKARAAWDTMTMLLMLYLAMSVPYRLAFDHAATSTFFVVFEIMIDLFFIADIFVNFRTAVFDESGDVCWSSKEIRRQYLTGWFTVDFVSSMPVEIITMILNSANNPTETVSNQATKILKMTKQVKTLRLIRLVKL